jgi:hypothetical protein
MVIDELMSGSQGNLAAGYIESVTLLFRVLFEATLILLATK